jgi:YebC/PmpR family DNA-binding regulatory protein
MPNENIDRGIKKGTGDLDGVVYEEVYYEGYGPGGVAIMVACLTDNRNRTMPEIRTAFNKNGGNLGEAGSVNYLFDRKGYLMIEEGQAGEDEIIELLMDYDIEDIKTEEGNIVITTTPQGFNAVSEILNSQGYNLAMNEITFIPKTTVPLDEKKAEQCIRRISILDDLDDTQNVYSNYDISDEIMMKLSEDQ